jgi:KaiC/GvpD/RAD55 family RecA-like ATPase/DNA-directed RNA polymerase subunit RPC12/RpoP
LSGKRKGRRSVVKAETLDDDTVQEAVEIEEDYEEDVWDAVEWEDLEPPTDENVFTKDGIEEVLRDACDKAWEDGVITDDERALLDVLREKLCMDEEVFEDLLEETKPVEEEPMAIEEREEEEPPVARPAAEIEEMDYKPPDPGKSSMITFQSRVRGTETPLGESFDLKKKDKPTRMRCSSCNSLIKVNMKGEKNRCPICGSNVKTGVEVPPAVRAILDQAKSAYKDGENEKARELYKIALQQDPKNKEATFFLRKMKHTGKKTMKRASSLDSRDIHRISTGVPRLDQMVQGGLQVGFQLLLKGPAFCGKDVLMDHIMASSLRLGFPVIYVSSNRAMKDVMKGIIRHVPDFKRFNKEGKVRMFDLFSKHDQEHVLKEGHRIFNIEKKDDFNRFRTDLMNVQEDLVKEYGGGVIIINSLSPLVTQVEQGDLMKFMQMLIARSKGYRFTNVTDLASGIHSDNVVNSVEYLMDGIVEFKEKDDRFFLRLKGFQQNLVTKDWIEYGFSKGGLDLFGSFTEERIA